MFPRFSARINYTAVSLVQIAMELCGCLLLADFVRDASSLQMLHSGRSRWRALPLYRFLRRRPLTETPSLFAIALALWR